METLIKMKALVCTAVKRTSMHILSFVCPIDIMKEWNCETSSITKYSVRLKVGKMLE